MCEERKEEREKVPQMNDKRKEVESQLDKRVKGE